MRKPKHILLMAWLSSLVLLLVSANCFAGIENNAGSLTGPFTGTPSYTTTDARFTDPNWSTFTTNSVKSTVALKVLDNVLISAAFTYTANIQVQYYTSPTASVTTVNTALTVSYVPGQGAKYKGLDVYNVPGAYKVIITVSSTSVTGTAPASSVQLTTDIVIDRTYPFVPANNINAVYAKLSNGRQLQVSWPRIDGADEYDVEWTTINNGNSNFSLIATDSLASSSPAIPVLEAALAQSFRNNASRITTDSIGCTLSMLSTDNILLVRIRQVQYNRATGVRVAGNWDYKNNTQYAIWTLAWDEQGQNWQYSAAFAEQGKKKEVISYFDGTLRGRQTVTLNNTDNVSIAQENIYDDLGRPTASILPAPFKETSYAPFLHYIPKFNLFSSTVPYTFANIAVTGCELNPSPLNTTAGASKYYSSSNNDFNTSSTPWNNYIPDAAGYPLSVTQYTADNTGRIKSQGGVGLAFQPGKSGSSLASRTTKYYYGKPEQWELDQLFANDVGYAEHYLKNMVIDPNGQISVSYLNASGKTIATALSGPVPGMLDSLPSYHPVQGSKPTNTHILKPEQFIFDSSALTLTANTTYLASVIGTDTLKFNIQRLVNKYPGTFQICSNCFYRMTVNVTNDCGDAAIPPISMPIQIGDSVAACSDTTLFPKTFVVSVLQPGEYNVNIRLAFDNSVIQSYADAFIKKGTDSLYIEQQFNYIKKRYLDSLDVSACYSDCHTCRTALGSQAGFLLAMQTKIVSLGVDTTGSLFNSWATGLYIRLKFKCDSMQSTCTYGSPCDATRALMVTDLTPGGQFAQFTATGTAVEPEVNAVSTNWRTVFPVQMPTDSAYIANKFTLPDGTVLSPNAATFTLANLVAYWQPRWAPMFLRYHPEYCKLRFCNSHAFYEEWDLRVKNDINKASDVPLIPNGTDTLHYTSANASDWLMNGDPFFKTGGAGHGYAAAMDSDLLSYSKNILHAPTSAGAVKGLMAYNDYLLYCQDKTGNTNTGSPIDSNWRNCAPNPACRVVDREWLAYRDTYFTLKDKYFTQLQNDTCGTSCPVGQTVNFNLPGACPGITEFSIKLYTGTPTCTGSQTVVVTHDPGTLNQLMTLIIYYPSNYDNNTLTHSVVIPSGQSQATFCIPNNIPVNVVKVQTAYCGSAPVYGNDPSYVVNFVSAVPTGVNVSCGGSIHTPQYKAYIQLKNSSGVLVNATTGVYLIAQYTSVGCGTTSDQTFFIPPGANTSDNFTYITNATCAPTCDVFFNCTAQLLYASNVSGLPLCSGVTPSNPQPPVNPCPAAYTTKISRFPTTGGTAIGNITGVTDGSQLTGPANTAIISQAADFCAANADTWMARLQPGLTAIGANSTQITQLRAALIGVCIAGGDQMHPMGASTIAPGVTYPDSSFGNAIKRIILPGVGHFTAQLNPWLIDAPYPYSPMQQSVAKDISYSNSSICSILQADSALALAAHKTLYNYLADTYGSAMTLSHADLNALKNSCYNCKFIIANDIALPSILDPQTPGCLVRANYTSAKTDMNTQFGGTLLATDPNYQTILSNYINQRFGFSLTYDDYYNFETGSAPQVCNTLPYSEVTPDPYDCVENAMTRAVNSGLADYAAYIAQQRQNFMASYMNTCKLARANANMVAVEQDYHYTLYYYDQADNLVRTVPPEGVTLVDPGLFGYIDKSRDLDTAAYTYAYNGPTIPSTPTNLADLSTALNAANGAVEMWLYNAGTNHYHWVEVTPTHDYLFQVGLAGNILDIDVFPLTQTMTNYITMVPKTGHYHVDLSSVQPLLPFTHVVFQGPGLGAAGAVLPQIYVNGTSLTVSNDNSVTPPFGFGITATSTGITYPDSIQSLKHLRVYTKQLSLATIKADAGSQFFYAYDTGYANWYRFNIPATGALPTTINSTTTDETAIYDTYPAHVLPTTYGYNSTNQVSLQRSQDGGSTRFWYDLLSRLVFSQNAKQVADSTNFSYTIYDAIGGITEVGQKKYKNSGFINPDYLADSTVTRFNTNGVNSQITDTYYDAPVPTVAGNTNGIATLPGQSNLRKRVAASTYTETQGGPALRATYYNYDLDGNVKTLWQQIDGLYQNSTNTGLKRIDYEYDLVSGKVNFVRYQDGQPDAFYYSYGYDADNRLTHAYSGITDITDTLTHSYLPMPAKKRDAAYYYYLHGPLRRMTIGNNNANVQGVDYAYTLQGWLKGVNSAYATAATDIGQDGADLTHTTARDAYGYSLGYYKNDYRPIGGAGYTAFNLKYVDTTGDITGQSLYNGNISNTTLAIAQLDGTAVNGYTYHYDQLNRLKKMRRHPGITGTSWSRSSITADYQENVTYDGNGNILTYGRNGAAPTAQTIDSLTYHYSKTTAGKLNNNRLQYITDAVANSNYSGDLTNQTNTTNYRYDAIGNLIYDAQSGITGNDGVNSITWSVYGKIQNIYKTSGTISYTYNPAGQRVSKTAAGLTTYYVRDAQGNPLAVYDNAHTTINWKEQQLYGSSRLGMWTPNVNLTTSNAVAVWDTIGGKQYELDNHLGNVLATVTDKRLQHTTNTTSIDYYLADVSTAQDYYPFGMLMPGRQTSTANYRYGFNGKENDNEVKGVGEQQDYGMRIYDPRVGRFLSVDPLGSSYVYYSPYQYAGNMPVVAVDIDGLEEYVVTYYKDVNNSTTKITISTDNEIDNRKGLIEQNIHKTGSTTHIAKGNVLVFEDKKLKNGGESFNIVNNRNISNGKLTPLEENIFKNSKATIIPTENAPGDDSFLYYGSRSQEDLYEADAFPDAKVTAYAHTRKFATDPSRSNAIVPPPNIIVASTTDGVLMNPGNKMIVNKYQYAVQSLVEPKIRSVITQMITKNANISNTTISLTIYTKPSNNSITIIKKMISQDYPNVKINVITDPNYKSIPGPKQKISSEDFNYKIDAKGSQ